MFVVEFLDGFGEGDIKGMNDREEKEVLLDGVDGLSDIVVIIIVVEVVDVFVAFVVDGVEFLEG